MDESTATLLAALVGAVVGSLGSAYLSSRHSELQDRMRRMESLAQEHLYPLQDAIESLLHRVHNLSRRAGKSAMSEEYFEITTAFAVGRVLACERRLALHGIYPIVDGLYPRLGNQLRENRLAFDLLAGTQFYDRVALSDVLTAWVGDRTRLVTFEEFRCRWRQDRDLAVWIRPLVEAATRLGDSDADRKLRQLHELGSAIASELRLPFQPPTAEGRSQANDAS